MSENSVDFEFQTSPDILQMLCQAALQAATQAARIIAEASTQPVEVLKKAGGDNLASQVVTEIDQRCDRVIRESLNDVSSRYDIAILTEECEDDLSRLRKDYFWCIDPLDGTLAFTRGQPGYAVSIGLVARDGTPIIGVVVDPVTSKQYSAIRGHGAFLGRGLQSEMQPWQLSQTIDSKLTVPIDEGLSLRKDFNKIMDGLQQWASEAKLDGVEQLHHAGTVMSAIWVAENPTACYFKIPKPKSGGGSLWDFAAIACICRELGLSVSDFFGQPLDLNREDSTFMNHRGAIVATDVTLASYLQGLG